MKWKRNLLILNMILVLKQINYEHSIIIRIDVSDINIWAILCQFIDGIENMVAFLSKKLSPQAKKWVTIDKEGYDIYYSINKWEYYLCGYSFIVQTDHLNLVYILGSETERVAR